MLALYDRTLVDVVGHTDSAGTPDYNLDLSHRRAVSVARYLARQGVEARRVRVDGQGERQPIVSNATPAERAQNRRIEIRLSPLVLKATS